MNQPLTAVPSIAPVTELDAACFTLQLAKSRLKECQAELRQAEESVLALVGAKDEGSLSFSSDRYKVTTTQPVNRSVDADAARQLVSVLPKDIADTVFNWKPSLSVAVYKQLEKYQPDTFKEISRAVTSKPGKVAVKVEAIES